MVCGGVDDVALSRVTSIEGLYLINFDPSSIKASESAILEYNRLRRIYKPTLPAIGISKERGFKAIDSAWTISKTLFTCQDQDEHYDEHGL